MKDTMQIREAYRSQITRYAQALALAKNASVESDVARGFSLDQVKMFTDGNLDKRFDKVMDQVELLSEAFDDLNGLVAEYIRTVPLAAYDTGCSDSDRFLEWLETKRPLTPEQRDCVTCQRGRHAVEQIARENRIAHIHFQDLSRMADRFTDELEKNPNLHIYLNPIRVWATFQTRMLLDDETDLPAEVLFFPCGNEVRTAALEPDGQRLLVDLEGAGPCTLHEWDSRMNGFEREELLEFCLDVADTGLIAFG